MGSILDRIKVLSKLVQKVTLETKPIILFNDVHINPRNLVKHCDNYFLTDSDVNPPSSNDPIDRYVFLDSSYNPPTLAHHYLLRNSVAQLLKENRIGSLNIILLLSCKNMDKHTISGANFEQRLALMELMAKDLILELETMSKINTLRYKCQIGLTNCGKFIDKAKLIHEYIQLENKENKNSQKYFIMGHDTITRFFDPKYYIEGYQENCYEATESKKVLDSLFQHLDPFFYKYRCHILHASREDLGKKDFTDLKQSCFDKILVSYSEFIHNICLQPKGPEDFSSDHIQSISSTQARIKLAKLKEDTSSNLNNLLSPSIITALKELEIY